jgi:hypothetical protein
MVKGVRAEKIVGNAGESLTVFKLSMMGYAASLIKQDGVDIAVVGGEGLIVAQRVEVKTVLQSDDMGRYSFTICKGKDRRCYTRKDCDIIALAALDIESVLFFPVESFKRNRSLTLTKNDFRNPSDGEEGVHFQMSLVYSQNKMGELLYKKK